MARKPITQVPPSPPVRRKRGFEAAGGLMASRIQKAGESRGFVITRLLTHWAEVAGPELAAMTRPVKVGYGREGLGATLTVLVSAAHAPLVQMRERQLRERVNAAYGYSAVSKIHFTQTAAQGFAEGKADFTHAPASAAPARLPPQPSPTSLAVAEGVADEGLRRALAMLAENVMNKTRT